MNELFAAVGAGGVVGGIAAFLVRWMTKHVDALVAQNREIAMEFRRTIENHLGENTGALNRMANMMERLINHLENGRCQTQ